MEENRSRLIEAEIWRLYKYFTGEKIDTFDIRLCAEYIENNLKEKENETKSLEISIDKIIDKIEAIRKYRQQLKCLQNIPQVKQRSPEWYEMRNGRLTASATAAALGKGKYESREQLLKKKAYPESEKWVTHTSGPLYHGTMLEAMTSRCYSQRMNDMVIHEFGMIKHPHMDCYGASPDGINELGIMIEIKTPYRRKVDGTILYEYMLQMQGQMAACGLLECDFVDCTLDVLGNEAIYKHSTVENVRTDHGIIVEYLDEKGSLSFEYSPAYLTVGECIEWKNNYVKMSTYKIVKNTYWKLYKIVVTRVHFDSTLWNSLIPEIERFWKDVLKLRETPYEETTTKTKKPKNDVKNELYNFIDSDDD
jgi:putative phage-type endonuclease